MEDLLKLKVSDLKKKCKEFGLSVIGTKAELVTRLQEHKIETGDESVLNEAELLGDLDTSDAQGVSNVDEDLLLGDSISESKDESVEVTSKSNEEPESAQENGKSEDSSEPLAKIAKIDMEPASTEDKAAKVIVSEDQVLYKMPRGRPSAPTNIVQENELLSLNQIKQERWCLFTLGQVSQLEWFARRRLIRNSFDCPNCFIPCGLNNDDGIDGKQWKCSRCSLRRSVRIDSFFSRSHLTLNQLVTLLYCWSCDFPQDHILHECGMPDNGHTQPDWYEKFRDLCENYLEDHPCEIGGVDSNTGEPIVVEIDQSNFFRRKYNRGNHVFDHWVFVGIERGTCRCFMVEVADKRRETLEQAIRRWILPGSHIVSDEWAAYAHIDEIGHGMYTHSIKNLNSVDPDINTQNAESQWMLAKRKLRRRNGTSDNVSASYLSEFIWRWHFHDWDKFAAIIYCLRLYFCK